MSTQDLLTDIYDKIQGEPRVSTVQYMHQLLGPPAAPASYRRHVCSYITVYKCQLVGSEVTDNKGRYVHKQAVASSSAKRGKTEA